MARKPNGRSSIFLGKDGKWHGWVTMGVKTTALPTADTASATPKPR
jgi:hypothetical protein